MSSFPSRYVGIANQDHQVKISALLLDCKEITGQKTYLRMIFSYLPVSYPCETSEEKPWLAGDKEPPFTLACKTAHGGHLLLLNPTK